ncbi:MAG: 30S ribosomal protein S20 [Planctomycetota bacterium]|nr:MAG: 30S ribosomal protein S20 [Planctomycetota bacterium]
MPHSRSAKKRLRQNEKRRIRNKSVRSAIKTWSKKVEQAVASQDRALAVQYFNIAQKRLDKAHKTGVYHRNTVARKKSRLAKLVASLG